MQVFSGKPKQAGYKLAPDLNYMIDLSGFNHTEAVKLGHRIVALTIGTGLVTALNLSGKWGLSFLELSQMGTTTRSVRVVLTVDGLKVWDSVNGSMNQNRTIYGSRESAGELPIICENSILLQMSASSTIPSAIIRYSARPLL